MKSPIGSFRKDRIFPMVLIMITLIVGLFSLTACATKKAYSGPELTSDKIAIIRPDADKAFTEIKILTIDEYELEFFESEVAVWPGNHKLSIEVKLAFPYLNDALAFNQNVSFNVQAGHVYTINGKIDSVKNEGFLWVTSDKAPDQFVGGAKIGPVKLLTSTP
ncbi:MAG: hypothetical protein MUE70_13190 [Desulfobacterales bacterium]|nr:hypothetical protein [Desulfobacterales bacterium]